MAKISNDFFSLYASTFILRTDDLSVSQALLRSIEREVDYNWNVLILVMLDELVSLYMSKHRILGKQAGILKKKNIS